MHKKLNQKGFGVVESVLLIIALALIIGIGVYVINANKDEKKSETKTSTQTQANSDDSKTTDASQNQSFLIIKEQGVKLPIKSATLSGITYTITSNKEFYRDDRSVISLVTEKVKKIACLNDASSKGTFKQVIFIFKQKEAAENSQAAGPSGVKNIGGNYYAFDGSTGDGGCQFSQADRATLDEFRKATLDSFQDIVPL